MKKAISALLSMLLMFTLAVPAFTVENPAHRLAKISEGYGIPMDALERLDPATIQSLYQDVTAHRFVSSDDHYVKVITTESGNALMQPTSYRQYLHEASLRVSRLDDSSGWMRFYTTVYEVDSKTGLASCAFTWLTPPGPRMNDAVGVALRNGTTQFGTANGFYQHSSPNDDYEYTFQAKDIRENGAGATASFRLRISDYASGTKDYVFLRLNFLKSGSFEGVTGTYAHQKYGIPISPAFSIDHTGTISMSGGGDIARSYIQDSGYVSMNW